MQFYRTIKTLVACATLLCAAQTYAADPEVQQFGNYPNWKYHTAFFRNPRRIMDTADKTYVFIHQHLALKDYTNLYVNPSGGLLWFDKNAPEKGFMDLRQSVDFHSSRMKYADLNPRTGQMVVQYVDNGLDIMNSDGSVTYIDNLTANTLPNANNITSINFDLTDSDIWIGTESGYLLIDGATRTVKKHATLGQPVSNIFRMGEKVIASINGSFYEASGAPSTMADLTDLGFGAANAPLSVVPLNDNSFIYIGKNGNTQGAAIWRARCQDGTWSQAADIVDTNSFFLLSKDTEVTSKTENNMVPNRDGYLLFSKKYVYQIYTTPNEDGSLKYAKRKSASNSSTVFGSWDFEKVWDFFQPGNFRYFSGSGEDDTVSWHHIGDYTYDGPTAYEYANLLYDPRYGMIVTDKGTYFNMGTSSTYDPLLLSAYKNGKWENYTPSYDKNKPLFTEESTELDTEFKKNKFVYPLCGPRAPMIDPAFPDYMIMGSMWNGVVAFNIANPRATALRYVAQGAGCANLPGQVVTFPKSSWATYCAITPAGFDDDNNYWFISDHAHSPSFPDNNYLRLRYWTVDSRRDALEKGQADLSKGFGEIKLNFANPYSQNSVALTLHHPDNKNKIVIYMSGGPRVLAIYDHNGTPEDTSDDTMSVGSNFMLDGGCLAFPYQVCDMAEDPKTGEIYVAHKYGLYVFKPSDPINSNTIVGRSFKIRAGEVENDVIGASPVNLVRFDEYGRLWIATQNQGVFGISADRSKVIAHYNMENSPIPSNNVYAVEWNPDTKTLFMSTAYGMAEVDPGYTPEADPITTARLTAVPEIVTHDFAGTVAIYNVAPTSSLIVTDSNGKTVASLPGAKDSMTHWNLLDNDGRKVPSGIYKIIDLSEQSEEIEIIVTR